MNKEVGGVTAEPAPETPRDRCTACNGASDQERGATGHVWRTYPPGGKPLDAQYPQRNREERRAAQRAVRKRGR